MVITKDEELLEQNGWEIECYSPFEIRHIETGSFATNWAATAVVDDLKQSEKLYKIRLISESYENDLIDKDKFVEEVTKVMS